MAARDLVIHRRRKLDAKREKNRLLQFCTNRNRLDEPCLKQGFACHKSSMCDACREALERDRIFDKASRDTANAWTRLERMIDDGRE
jgi:hypothetical protein